MDFKSLLAQLDQLNEATEKTKTGLKHTAEPGGYGRKDDEDEEGNKVKAASTEKKGRGRPKKATQTSGEDKKYDFSAFGVKAGKDVKLPKYDKKKTTKHSLKEYFDAIDQEMIAEAEQIQIKPASQMPKQPGQTSIGQKPTVPGQQQVAGQPQKQTQVIAQGNKTLGTVDNPQLAQQIKQSIGKGEMTLMPNQQVNELSPGTIQSAAAKRDAQQPGQMSQATQRKDPMTHMTNRINMTNRVEEEMDEDSTGDYSAKKARAGKDIGKPGKAFGKIAKDAGKRYGSKAAGERVAGAVLAKLRAKTNEADMPPHDALASPLTLESRAKADNKVNELSVNTLNRVHRAAVRDANDASRDGDEEKAQKRYDLAGKASNKAELKNRAAGLKPSGQHDLGEAKKPDANKNGIPDYAEDGKGKNDLKKKKDKIDEGMMDKLKGIMVPKLMKLLGPDAEQIANAVKQATGGDFTPSKENAIRVVKALGIDKAAAQGQSHQMAEGIAGNWQGKLIQALYTLGLLGSAGAASAMWHSVGGSWFTAVGVLLLMMAGAVYGNEPGQVGAMGNFGNKGTSTQRGLDIHGMPTRNTNVKESAKKKVKEGMDHRIKAARHAGKSHALSKQGYNCTYDDMEEAKQYHDGYKEGLDECYGQMPIQGYVGEAEPVVNTMASYGAEEGDLAEADIEESPFSWAAKNTPKGEKFKLGGKEFVKNDAFAFESLEQQLNALLEAKEEVAEGMTVSISKGQQGQPDSVSVNAQDAEADQLLSIIKQAGLGLFGGDEVGQTPQSPAPMTVDVDGGEGPQADIEVVDDHDDMLSLIRKMTGQGSAQQAGDYEEEGGEEAHSHDEANEETCEACGESACGCDDNKEPVVDEDESMDQREYEVAEEINPNNNDEAEEEQSDATRDAALAQAAGKNFADTDAPLEEGGDGGEAGTDAIAADDAADKADAEEEDLDESYANSDDDQFETDIDFMTKVISGGLNKQKSTGQTTIPVIAGQNDRMGYNTNESVNDWKKLAGIK